MLALAERLQVQAYHCSLIVSSVYLLLLSNHENSSLIDHPAVQKLLPLLDRVAKGLKNKEWNEVESKNRHQLVVAILNNLIPMFTSILCSDVPLETGDKAATVPGLIAASVPKSLVDVVEQIAKGKVRTHTPCSVALLVPSSLSIMHSTTYTHYPYTTYTTTYTHYHVVLVSM